MPTMLDDNENDQFKKWMIADNPDPFAGGKPLAPASSTPVVPAHPDLAPTDNNQVEEVNKDERIQDSHPGHTADDLSKYVKGQESQLDKYGPEQEQSVMDSILKSQGSLGNRLSRAGAGLGDALMGVAGKSSPGFLNSLENREGNQEKMLLESVPNLAKLNAEKMAGKERLQNLTSGTPLGQATAQAYQKVFKQLFPNMSSAELDALTKNPSVAAKIFPDMAPVIDKQVQNELKKAQIEATIGNQQSERELEKEKIGEEKRKTDIEHPFMAAIDKLRNGSQTVPSQEGGPLGPTTTRNGKTYIWSPVSKKYHPQ